MRRIAALFLLSSFVGCGDKAQPPAPISVGSGDVVVVVDLEPFGFRIAHRDGRIVLSSLGAGDGASATVDTPNFVTQPLPGWDGYEAGEAAFRRASRARVLSSTRDSAKLALEGDGVSLVFSVVVDGSRVELSLAAKSAQNKTALAFATPKTEHFFGMGERYASVDHRGLSLYSYAEEGALGGGEGVPPGPKNPFPNGPSMTYFPVPFFLSTAGYGMHLATTHRNELHFASERPDTLRAAVNASSFAAVVYVNDDPLVTLDAYTRDTGRPPIPAPWVFGLRRRSGPGTLVDGVPEWRAMRDKKIPCTAIDDAVHFLPAMSHVGREAELSAWTKQLHDFGYKAIAYNNPYVASDDPKAKADYDHGVANGFFVKLPDGKPAKTWFISGSLHELSAIDLTNPTAVTWFKSLLQRTLDLGYDGWMHDFGEYVPREAVFFDGRRGDEVHNAYPVLSAKAAYELLEEKRKGDYLFFVRSGGAGTQAYVPAVWGGDAEATFDETQGLPSSVRGGVNLSLTGVPYWGSDMTGFKCLGNEPRDKDVFLRWVELGAVSPIMMEQNACSNPVEKGRTKWGLWNDDETISVYRTYALLHTRLAPYFEALAARAHEKGTPLTLHPFLLHPKDPAAWAVEDAFYVGDALYASPVVRRAQTSKTTWIPPGRWVDLLDGTVVTGGAKVTLPAPLGKLPLLLKENALVPLLDPSIDTLASALDPSVVTREKVKDVLDVVVVLAPSGRATLKLADGTTLEAARETDAGNPLGLLDGDPETCSGCYRKTTRSGAERVQITSALAATSELRLGDLRLVVGGGNARRYRWDVTRL